MRPRFFRLGRVAFAGFFAVGALGACRLLTDFDGFAGAQIVADAGVDTQIDVRPIEDAATDAADAGGKTLPPCPEVGDPSALFVDARNGADTNDGKTAPFRSITKALAAARAIGPGATPPTICIRGGTADAPTVYSEETTGEVFPLRPDVAGTTLRGEGAGRVRVSYLGSGPDGGLGFPYAARGQAVLIDQGDITIQGLTFEVALANAIDGNGLSIRINDAEFTVTDGGKVDNVITFTKRATVERVSMQCKGAGTCISANYAQIDVSDSTFVGGGTGLAGSYGEIMHVQRSTFRGGTHGIWAIGNVNSLETTGCTFDSEVSAGVFVRPAP